MNDDLTEDVARAMFDAAGRTDLVWDDVPDVVREGMREMAKVAYDVIQGASQGAESG